MSSKSAFRLLFSLGVTLVVLSPLRAQEASTESPATTGHDPTDFYREQTIYIPYQKLRETFEKEGRGVFLPYEKFHELWKAARDKQPQPHEIAPPVKAVITEIANEAHIQDDVIRVTALVTIDLLGRGWIEVPLRLSDAALLSATIDQRPALVVADPHGGQTLLVKKDKDEPEQVQLRLEYAKSITKAPGQNSVAFQAPLAPINRWRIRVPEAGVKVNIHPMLAATEVPPPRVAQTPSGASAGSPDDEEPAVGTGPRDETVVLAFVGAAPTLRIEWTHKAEGASGLDALVSVQTEQEVTIDEGVTRSLTRLAYDISRAELTELKIEVPADQKVVNVVDANVRQWNVQANGQTQLITVGLFQPARSGQTVIVELEKFTEESGGELLVPMVTAVAVGRQRGIVVVRVADGLRAQPVRRAGLSQLDVEEIPADLKSRPWAFSYRYAALPFDLALGVEKVEPRIDVDQLVEAYLEPQKLTLDLFAKYSIQRAGTFELVLELPEGFEVRQVSGHEAANVKAAAVDSHVVENADGGGSRLKVNLASKAQGDVGLLVQLERPLDDPNLLSPTGQSSLINLVPARVADDSVERSSGRLVVYAPESLRVAIERLDGLRNISFEEAFHQIVSMRAGRFGDLRPVQALAFSQGPASAQLAVQRRQPHVTARQLLVARVQPGVVKYEATFFFDILYSSVKALRIDLPADLAGRVRNETKSLHETVLAPAPADLAAGYVAWSLAGQTELLGPVQCRLSWESPIQELAIGSRVDVAVPRLIPRDVERADGQIVLVKAEAIDLVPKGQPQGLVPIDPELDLMAGVRIADAAAALEFHDDWNLTLTATRYQPEELKHTSIEQAVLRLVITRSNRISVQTLYRMRSSRQRLEIQLPEEVATGKIEFDNDPLRINGHPVTMERGDNNKTFFVPLVAVSSGEPFVLELRYTTAGGGRRLAYPTFPDEPAVQKVNLIAYVPDEWAYLGKRGPWTEETIWRYDPFLRPAPRLPVDVNQLINQLIQGIKLAGNPAEDFPVDGRPLLFTTLRPPAADVGALRLTTISSQLLSGLVFGIVALGGVLLLRRPAVDRIVALCALVAMLLVAGVFLPTLVNAIFGHMFVLAAFVVALLWLAAFSVRSLPKLAQIPIGRARGTTTAAATAREPGASPRAEERAPADSAGDKGLGGKEGGPSNG